MAEEVKKVKKNVRSSSKVRKNTDLTSEELLEQIMNKKKEKKSNASKKTKTVNKKTESKKVENKNLTDEELLENILNKKKTNSTKKKTSKKSTSSSSRKKTTNSKSVEKSEIINSTEVNKSKNNEKQQSDVFVEDITDNNEESDGKVNNDLASKNKDLIITREIRFDDINLNLKDKKVLKELRKAIEDFDNLEDLEEIHSSLDLINDADNESVVPESVFVKKSNNNSDDYLLNGVVTSSSKKTRKDNLKYDNNDVQKLFLILVCLLLVSILIFILVNFLSKDSYAHNDSEKGLITEVLEDDESSIKELAYNDCLNREKNVSDINDTYMNVKQELDDYISEHYKASVAYLDLTTGFEYKYNYKNSEKPIDYYAASTTKTLAALYIYVKAAAGEIDLDSTMVYSSKYTYSASKGMKKHKYGDKVSLRVLVKYAIIYSDNSAYRMLLDYVGRKELDEFYRKNYNEYPFFTNDDFGTINITEGISYMLCLNDFINNNGELGKELQSFFLEAEQNDLALPEEGIEAAHKYGQYLPYYHDIGIVYDEHPYIVVILTLEGKGNFEDKVKDISHHVYNMHKTFYENREKICTEEVYGV